MPKKFPKPPSNINIHTDTKPLMRSFTSAAEIIRVMKVTMQKIAAGPQGVARRGTVLDVPEKEGQDLIDRQIARAYDSKRDVRAIKGWTKAQDNQE
jgi:hypothetical protein